MGHLFNKFIKSKIQHKTYKGNNISNKNNIFFGELYKSYSEMIGDIIIYVLLLCNILTILFFTVVKDVEREIVKEQINNLLDDIFNTNNINKEYNLNSEVKNIFDKLNIKYNYKEELVKKINEIEISNESEKKIKENNDTIFNNSLIILSIINVFCIVILLGLWKYKNFNIIYYIKKNFILSIFVIITELIFLYIISKNYIYIDKKYIFIETMKKISN